MLQSTEIITISELCGITAPSGNNLAMRSLMPCCASSLVITLFGQENSTRREGNWNATEWYRILQKPFVFSNSTELRALHKMRKIICILCGIRIHDTIHAIKKTSRIRGNSRNGAQIDSFHALKLWHAGTHAHLCSSRCQRRSWSQLASGHSGPMGF